MNETPLPIVITGHVDHGKSTLIGRLLYDTGSLQQERYSEITDSSSELGRSTEFAFVLDAFEEERSRGITIDTSQIYFTTEKRKYVIIDAPGHKEFIRNMVTGASYAETAILLVDANEGIQEQTLRHVHLLSLVGIREICIAVNKIDLVSDPAEVFSRIRGELTDLMAKLSIQVAAFVPISALHGVNIAQRNPEIGWYDGPCLLEVIDALEFRPFSARPLRFPVQDVYDWGTDPIIVGRVESGTVEQGMQVCVFPQGRRTRVTRIVKFQQNDVTHAGFGEAVGLVLEDAGLTARGNVCAACDGMHPTQEMDATVFWFQGDYRLHDRVTIRCATQETEGVMAIVSKFDPAEMFTVIDRPDRIEIGEIARVRIRTEREMVVDSFDSIPEMGRFVIEKNGIPMGGGIFS